MLTKIKPLLITLLLFIAQQSISQTFEKVSPDISFGNYFGYLVLADLDNDGDPEIIQTGLNGFNIFNNNGSSFESPIEYPELKGESQVMVHTLDVGDIDRDGYIDILQSGGPNNRIFYILLNTNPGFTDVAGNYLNGLAGASFLGDFEGDGDLDIVFSGADKWSNDLGGIMINRKNGQFDSGPWFTKHDTWFATWCDLDQDSQLEVVQSVGGSNYFINNYLLENNFPGMTVSKTLAGISPFIYNASFADYDADGDLDMLAKQYPNKIYNNVNGDFVDSGITFPDSKTAEFADVNNDGLYDVIIGGMMTDTWQVFETGIYLNQNNGTFAKLNAQIPASENVSAAIADIDDDGDIDIASLSGVFKNNSPVSNAKPDAPVPMGSNVSGTTAILTWQAASDDHTPANALTYNISVRSEDGAIIVPGHSLSSGKRQIYKTGNAYNSLSFNLSCLQQGTYYWKVQTLDASFHGSAFSAEQSFTITTVPPVAPVDLTAKPVSDVGIEITWNDQSETEDEFIIFRKNSDSEFDFYPIDTVAANQTGYLDTLYLAPQTSYTYQVVASNCAYPDEFRSQTSATTFPRAFVNSGWLDLGETEGTLAKLGDYDNDGDLDLVLSYSTSSQTKLFRFDGDAYVDSGIQFPFIAVGAQWLDYNNDGFIDLLFSGGDFFESFYKVYKNEAGLSFSEVADAALPSGIEWQGGLSFGDYDNDGDEDVLLQEESVIHIYDNDGKGKFSRKANINLSGYLKSEEAWADYDQDGDLDILANKAVSCDSYIVVVFENRSDNTFLPVEFPTIEGATGEMEWGDYDNDGYPDIMVAGQTTCGNGYGINRIYHNNRNKTFTPATSLVQLIYDVNVDWGDYDNDGDFDVFAYGDPFGGYSRRARIFRNDGNKFKETNIDYLLQSTQHGKAVKGDIDNDGDLDYVILGEIDYVNPRIEVYRNQYAEGWDKPNHAPSAPTTPVSEVQDQSVTLSWSPSLDNETEQTGLHYNIYIMDEKDSIVINSYSLINGNRKIVKTGNVRAGTSITIANLMPGTYKWAVQSIDKGFKGSAFSEEDLFVIAEAVTEVEDEVNRLQLSLYPNPATNHLKLTLKRVENNMQVVISDLLGKPVLVEPINMPETDLDITALPSGLYAVTIFGKDTQVGIRKIIKR